MGTVDGHSRALLTQSTRSNGRWTRLCAEPVMVCIAVEFIDPLGRGGKSSNIPGGIFWLDLVVLVERADRQSAAGLGQILRGGIEECSP